MLSTKILITQFIYKSSSSIEINNLDKFCISANWIILLFLIKKSRVASYRELPSSIKGQLYPSKAKLREFGG